MKLNKFYFIIYQVQSFRVKWEESCVGGNFKTETFADVCAISAFRNVFTYVITGRLLL